MKKVALIVGHSQRKQGAYNKKFDTTEFSVNKKLAIKVAEKLALYGIKPELVYRTGRYKDLPGQVNVTGVDIAVSFHANAFNTKASGYETLYYHKSSKSRMLANAVQGEFTKEIGDVSPNRGIKPKQSGDRGALILKETSMPCVLVEPFFIDNNDDFVDIWLYRSEGIATAIANGIKKYLDEVN